MRGVTIGVIILLILVLLFYAYYLISGDWKSVELSILDSLIDIIVTFIANIAAVIIGLDILFPESKKISISELS